MALSIVASLLIGATALDPSPSELAMELQRAANASESVFRVPEGEYDFGSQSLVLAGANKFELDGQGATLWFACGFGFQVRDSAAVRVHNLTIDYDPPCFAQGVITSVEPNNALIHANFDSHFLRPELGILANYTPKVTYWDPQTNRMLRNHSIPFTAINNFFANSARDTPNSWAYAVQLEAPLDLSRTPGVGPGSYITVHARMDGGVYNGPGQAYLVWNSSSIVSEDVNIFGGGAMGFVEGLGEGGNTYRRARVSRRKRRGSNTLRLLSTNVDGFHSGQLRHGPLIEDCEIAYTGDDLANIHSRIELVLQRLNERSLLMLDTEGGHTLGAPGLVGATFTFRHINTFEFSGIARVEAVRDVGLPVGWNDPADYAANLTATLNGAPYYARIRPDTILPRVYVVNFTHALPAEVDGMWSLFESDTRENRGAVVRGSHWHDGYARVLLLKSSRSVISGNRFERAGGILAETAQPSNQFWLEGPMSISNVTMVHNTIVGCGGENWLRDSTGASSIILRNNTVLETELAYRTVLPEIFV